MKNITKPIILLLVAIIFLTSCSYIDEYKRKKKEEELKELKEKELQKAKSIVESDEFDDYTYVNNVKFQNTETGVKVFFYITNRFKYTPVLVDVSVSFVTKTWGYGKVGIGVNDRKNTWKGRKVHDSFEVRVNGGDNKYIVKEYNTMVKGYQEWLGPFFIPMSGYIDKKPTPIDPETLEVNIYDSGLE